MKLTEDGGYFTSSFGSFPDAFDGSFMLGSPKSEASLFSKIEWT
jgi:hypothetical protein